jgi:hypothetical protein
VQGVSQTSPALDFTKLLKRYAPVRLQVDKDGLQRGDERALGELIRSAAWIDDIYWKQHAGEEWLSRFRAWNNGVEISNDLKRLLKINFGPWDTFDNDRPFLAVKPRPPGGALYPEDLTRTELDQYVAAHPESRRLLFGNTTLVRRIDGELTATPYEVVYKEELAKIAEGLRRASKTVTHRPFSDFLLARAKGLTSGSLGESERLWIAASNSPIDIAIGPYEVYDDGLIGVKTSYEATVIVRHPMTEQLARFEAMAPELERRLPGAAEPADTRRRFAVGVYDVVFTAGLTNMGGKAIAATLPNDEGIRSEFGARLLLFRNVIAAKFSPILKPMAARLLCRNQLHLVREDAFLFHTLLHEMAHALGRCYVRQPPGNEQITINQALRERYSAVEECRADLLGMVFLMLLADSGFLPPELKPAASVTFVINNLRALRFGAGDDYSRGAAVILSYFVQNGSLRMETDGRLSVEPEKVGHHIENLAATLQGIASDGDYAAAGELFDNLGSVPKEIASLAGMLEDLPIDLEFIQDNNSSH